MSAQTSGAATAQQAGSSSEFSARTLVRSGRKPRCAKASALEPPVSEAPLPPARQLAWLLVQPTSVLDEGEAGVVSRIEQDDTARAVTDLACRFTALVRAAGKGKTVTDDQDADAAADIAPGSRKHGAATLLPSRRSPRDWMRTARPSGLL